MLLSPDQIGKFSMVDMCRLTPSQFADEFVGAHKAFEAGNPAGYTNLATLGRYAAMVYAMGMFMHTTAFSRELREYNYNVDADLIVHYHTPVTNVLRRSYIMVRTE